jgi:tetratricopeptide (TPR) repeat protein
MGVRKTTVIAVAALLASLQSLALADQVTDRARLLLQQKNPQAAYELLAPLEPRRAGEVEFDYLLGISALDSGHREQAVFALERVLAVNPNYAEARAEIARAYFEMGEKENAKREFENVRNTNPPEAVKKTIDRYLSALEVGPARRLNGFVELGFGHDSNVNSATASSQIAVPAFGGIVVTLDSSSVRQSDNFIAAAGGLNYLHEFSREWAMVAGAALRGQFNRQHNEFDTGTLDGNLGLRWSRAKETVTVGYQGQDFQVDNKDFRTTNGLVAQWQHSYSQYDQASIFAQFADLKYPDDSIRDATRTILGVAFGHGWNAPSRPVVFGSLYGGDEKAKDSNHKELGHKPIGVRFGGQVSMSSTTELFGLLSYEQRSYGEFPPSLVFFDVTRRRDRQADLRLGVNYTFRPTWLLVPQISYTNNQSNIELNKYNRSVVSVAVRKVF